MQQMSERVTIEARVGTIDALGQKVETWETVVETWASVTTRTGTESVQGSQLVAMVTKFFKIRHVAGLRADMRVVYGGDNYNIIALNYERRDNSVTISAVMGDNQ